MVVLMLLVVVVLLFVLALPVLSGIGSYSAKETRAKKEFGDANDGEADASGVGSARQYAGYTYEAPDVDVDEEAEQKLLQGAGEGLKKRINRLKVTSEDIPIHFGINAPRVEQETVVRNYNTKPTEYDFDVDDFIEKEHAKDVASRFHH